MKMRQHAVNGSQTTACDEIVEAERVDPDPSRLNEFVASQLSSANKDRIVRWFR